MLPEEPVPVDFPRALSGAVPGSALKFLAQKVGNQYVVGISEDELRQRHKGCVDLLNDLIAYCARKRQERTNLTDEELFTRVKDGLFASPDLGTTPAENDWVLRKLCEHESWNFDLPK